MYIGGDAKKGTAPKLRFEWSQKTLFGAETGPDGSHLVPKRPPKSRKMTSRRVQSNPEGPRINQNSSKTPAERPSTGVRERFCTENAQTPKIDDSTTLSDGFWAAGACGLEAKVPFGTLCEGNFMPEASKVIPNGPPRALQGLEEGKKQAYVAAEKEKLGTEARLG